MTITMKRFKDIKERGTPTNPYPHSDNEQIRVMREEKKWLIDRVEYLEEVLSQIKVDTHEDFTPENFYFWFRGFCKGKVQSDEKYGDPPTKDQWSDILRRLAEVQVPRGLEPK